MPPPRGILTKLLPICRGKNQKRLPKRRNQLLKRLLEKGALMN